MAGSKMLGTSIPLFNVGETTVRLHPAFFLLIAWIGAVSWLRGGPAAAAEGVIFISLLFVCVLLHEFGHVYMARRYGIATRDVTLLPIGGVASLERLPEKPSQEIAVALAGPAVNVVIALVLFALLAVQGVDLSWRSLAELDRSQVGLLTQLAFANAALVVFNLIPAFPMDGGRVLRALLASSMDYVRATRAAAMVGQVIAVLLGFLGLFGNPVLILIAVFVFLAASGESGFVQARDLTRGRRVTDAMITSFSALGVQSTVGAAADLLLRTTQHEFPVLDGAGRLRGVATREAIIEALKTVGDSGAVMDIVAADVPTVPDNTLLDAVFDRMRQEGTPLVGVTNTSGACIGYLTLESIAELIMVGTARAARARVSGEGRTVM